MSLPALSSNNEADDEELGRGGEAVVKIGLVNECVVAVKFSKELTSTTMEAIS